MFHDFTYPAVLAAATRGQWQLDDVFPPGATLDFACPFMPESLARTAAVEGLSDGQRLILNHIRGHDYLSMFGLVEEFILPFVLDHARPQLSGDDERVRALLQFASEEAKHIQLFKRFHAAFVAGFGHECAMIGPAEAIGAEVLRHDPLSVALVVLMIEWMSQSHYLDSVRGNQGLDPLFANLLRCHWIEEAQHAKLDTLMVEALAEGRDEASIMAAIDEFFEIGAFLDDGLRQQTKHNIAAFEEVTGCALSDDAREQMLAAQHQAMRWTYLGSGLVHPQFRKSVGALSPAALERIDEAAPAFA
jgi:hypothetical protein